METDRCIADDPGAKENPVGVGSGRKYTSKGSLACSNLPACVGRDGQSCCGEEVADIPSDCDTLEETF